jgi:hypothetical protein
MAEKPLLFIRLKLQLSRDKEEKCRFLIGLVWRKNFHDNLFHVVGNIFDFPFSPEGLLRVIVFERFRMEAFVKFRTLERERLEILQLRASMAGCRQVKIGLFFRATREDNELSRSGDKEED